MKGRISLLCIIIVFIILIGIPPLYRRCKSHMSFDRLTR